MAQITVKYKEQESPVESVTLVLSAAEARILKTLVGSTSPGIRLGNDFIYDVFAKLKDVQSLRAKGTIELQESCRGKVIQG